jgi:hypothetical protein
MTNRKTRAMCYDCREFYCVPCVQVNLSQDEALAAIKSTKWVCFVCTWDDRQVRPDPRGSPVRTVRVRARAFQACPYPPPVLFFVGCFFHRCRRLQHTPLPCWR